MKKTKKNKKEKWEWCGDMNEKETNKKQRLSLILMCIAVFWVIMAIVVYIAPYQKGYERQHVEEQMAVSYLQELRKQKGKDTDIEGTELETEIIQNSPNTKIPVQNLSKGTWRDEEYYELNGITYTPDYAVGAIDCVLIIPKIHLCRGVYTGTWDEIYHNLDVWMTTTARPDYRLGETHYCIYGHNTPRLNLSFNRLQSLEEGDIFYLVNEEGAYQYRVTHSFGISRSDSTRYTDDFSIESTCCYLITCGRGAYQYLDLFVEGQLQEFTELSAIDINQYFIE